MSLWSRLTVTEHITNIHWLFSYSMSVHFEGKITMDIINARVANSAFLALIIKYPWSKRQPVSTVDKILWQQIFWHPEYLLITLSLGLTLHIRKILGKINGSKDKNPVLSIFPIYYNFVCLIDDYFSIFSKKFKCSFTKSNTYLHRHCLHGKWSINKNLLHLLHFLHAKPSKIIVISILLSHLF